MSGGPWNQEEGESCLHLVTRSCVSLAMYHKMRIIPMIMAGFAESVRKDISCGSATALVPPSFTLILNSCRVSGREDYLKISNCLLQRNICIVLGPCTEALRRF